MRLAPLLLKSCFHKQPRSTLSDPRTEYADTSQEYRRTGQSLGADEASGAIQDGSRHRSANKQAQRCDSETHSHTRAYHTKVRAQTNHGCRRKGDESTAKESIQYGKKYNTRCILDAYPTEAENACSKGAWNQDVQCARPVRHEVGNGSAEYGGGIQDWKHVEAEILIGDTFLDSIDLDVENRNVQANEGEEQPRRE